MVGGHQRHSQELGIPHHAKHHAARHGHVQHVGLPCFELRSQGLERRAQGVQFQERRASREKYLFQKAAKSREVRPAPREDAAAGLTFAYTNGLTPVDRRSVSDR